MDVFGIDDVELVDRTEVARRNLKNLLTSYADEADVFTESVQNAVDAITTAAAEGLYTPDDSPRITIVLGRPIDRQHYIYVADNGIGMTSEVAKRVTVPGYSHGKGKGRSVGYKGVGASYFFAATNKAALRTTSRTGELTEYTVYNSHNWIKNEGERRPEIQPIFDVPKSVKDLPAIKRGTETYFQFHDSMKPATLNNIVVIGGGAESELRNWMSFLCAKTPIGAVIDRSDLSAEIVICLDRGDGDLVQQVWKSGTYSFDNRTTGYPFPHLVLNTAKNTSDIDKTEDYRRHTHTGKHAAVFKLWTANEIIQETTSLEQDEIAKLQEHLEGVYGYFCYSTDVLKEINSRLGSRANLIRYGIRIASDGVAQGRNVDLSLTSNQGLDRQTHIVLMFRNLELDTGRKISADEVIGTAVSKLGRRVVDVMKEYRWAMKKKDRPDVQSDLAAWRRDVDVRHQTALTPLVFPNGSKSPLLVDPSNEQEVIALFAALLTTNKICGIDIAAISGFERYDCLANITDLGNEIRNPDDPLAVRVINAIPVGEKLVIEFKYSFDELLQDFSDKKKNPAEIDILVCWSVPQLSVERGRFQPCYAQWRDYRALHSASYVWTDENETSSFSIISLKNVMAEILAHQEIREGKDGQGRALLKRLEQHDSDHLV